MTINELSRLAKTRPAPGWAESSEGQAVVANVTATAPSPDWAPRGRHSLAFVLGVAAAVVVAVTVSAAIRVIPSGDATASDLDFFSQFAISGASEVESFRSVDEMARSADAVVTGRVVDVVVTRVIVGEETDRVPVLGLVIEPREVKGQVPTRFADRLTVEFMASSDTTEASLPEIRGNLPKATAVWFLRSKAEEAEKLKADYKKRGREMPKSVADMLEREKDFYRLVSSQGFYVQSDSGLRNPMADQANEGVDPVADEASKIKTTKGLMVRVEKARG